MSSSSNGHIDGVTFTINYMVREVIVTPFMSLCFIYKTEVYLPEHIHKQKIYSRVPDISYVMAGNY